MNCSWSARRAETALGATGLSEWFGTSTVCDMGGCPRPWTLTHRSPRTMTPKSTFSQGGGSAGVRDTCGKPISQGLRDAARTWIQDRTEYFPIPDLSEQLRDGATISYGDLGNVSLTWDEVDSHTA